MMKDVKMQMNEQHRCTAVTFGKFDGLHLGHQTLIKKIADKKTAGLVPAVFTFTRPPREILDGGLVGAEFKSLLTKIEKERLLQQFGVQEIIEYETTKENLSMTAEDFVTEIVQKQLNAKFIVVGEDFRFGRGRKGDVSLLKQMAASCGYEIEIVKKERMDDAIISSSRIRGLLEQGQIEQVNRLLGYSYGITGEIVKGNQLGRTWNVPTINVFWPEEKLQPVLGVYFSRVYIEDMVYFGMTNIGKKPSVEEKHPVSAETYLYDCNEKLYGKMAQIELLHFHRQEMKFDSFDELITQLHRDVETGKRRIESGKL